MTFSVNMQQQEGDALEIQINLYQILFDPVTVQVGTRTLDLYKLTGERVKLDPESFSIDQIQLDSWFRIACYHGLLKFKEGYYSLNICKRKEFFNAPHLNFEGWDLFIPSLYRPPETIIKLFKERLVRRIKGLTEPIPNMGFRVIPEMEVKKGS